MEPFEFPRFGVSSKEKPTPNRRPRKLATRSPIPFSASSNVRSISAAKKEKRRSLLKRDKRTSDPTVARSTTAIKLQASSVTEKKNDVLKSATWTRTLPSLSNAERILNLNSQSP